MQLPSAIHHFTQQYMQGEVGGSDHWFFSMVGQSENLSNPTWELLQFDIMCCFDVNFCKPPQIPSCDGLWRHCITPSWQSATGTNGNFCFQFFRWEFRRNGNGHGVVREWEWDLFRGNGNYLCTVHWRYAANWQSRKPCSGLCCRDCMWCVIQACRVLMRLLFASQIMKWQNFHATEGEFLVKIWW